MKTNQRRLHCITLLSILAMLFSVQTVNAKVYKWVTEDGTVVYSDQPHPDAEVLDIKPLHPYKAPEPKYTPFEETEEPETTVKSSSKYRSLTIDKPQHDETITGNSGSLTVSVSSNPQLKEGDKFQLVLNGTEIGSPSQHSQFNLDNVNRGSHNISVKIIDKGGRTLITSSSVTVHVKRTIVKKKPVPTPR